MLRWQSEPRGLQRPLCESSEPGESGESGESVRLEGFLAARLHEGNERNVLRVPPRKEGLQPAAQDGRLQMTLHFLRPLLLD